MDKTGLKKQLTYRAVTALLLAVLVLQVVVLKEAHHLLDHHHEITLHCDSADTHLHGSEYAPEDCFICDFHFAPAQLAFADFPLQLPVQATSKVLFFDVETIKQQAIWHFHRRGPPSFLS